MSVLSKQFLVRLSPKEKAAWDAAAKKSNLRTNTFVRLVVNAAIGQSALHNTINKAIGAQKVNQAARMREARAENNADRARDFVSTKRAAND